MSLSREGDILSWIFELGEIDNVSKEDLLNFMKYRVDDSLKKINMKTKYNITPEQYRPMVWFEEEVFANSLDDFFAKDLLTTRNTIKVLQQTICSNIEERASKRSVSGLPFSD